MSGRSSAFPLPNEGPQAPEGHGTVLGYQGVVCPNCRHIIDVWMCADGIVLSNSTPVGPDGEPVPVTVAVRAVYKHRCSPT